MHIRLVDFVVWKCFDLYVRSLLFVLLLLFVSSEQDIELQEHTSFISLPLELAMLSCTEQYIFRGESSICLVDTLVEQNFRFRFHNLKHIEMYY